MDPIDVIDILQVLSQLVRAGAEYVVGFIVGVGIAGTGGLWLWRFAGGKTRKILQGLQTDLESERKSRSYITQWYEKAKEELQATHEKLTLARHELEETQQERARLTERLCQVENDLSQERQLRQELEAARADLSEKLILRERAFAEEEKRLNAEIQQLKACLEAKEEELNQLRCEKADLEKSLAALQTQLESTFDGLSEAWYRSARQLVPDFLPLEERHCPIIAFVNLKGGVGKTTITAYLGAALAAKGKRVLLVDLDYQSSLTHLCLPPERRPWAQASDADSFRSWMWVGRFLLEPEASLRLALERAVRAYSRPDEYLYIWPSHEWLEQVETQLFVELLFGAEESVGVDQRFRLRRVLHQPEISQWYDFVLLDCPPRVTAGCVNALMAADYYVVPVRPDSTSGDAVPRLLNWVKKFQGLRTDQPLHLLGLVFNEASKRSNSPGGFIRDHMEMIEQILQLTEAVLKTSVFKFPTTIKIDTDFARASKGGGLAWPALRGSRIWPIFEDLASDLLQRLKELGEQSHESEGAA